MFIGRRRDFLISIGSRKSKDFQNFVLISNLQFRHCQPPHYNLKPVSELTCPVDQFKCDKSYGNCLKPNAICDFEADCWLAEDETNCTEYVGRCDFEDMQLCDFWAFESDDERLAFQIESGLHGIRYLPSVDHTRHSARSLYASFYLNTLPNYLNSTVVEFSASIVSRTIYANISANCR